jgi:hypothetical protein
MNGSGEHHDLPPTKGLGGCVPADNKLLGLRGRSTNREIAGVDTQLWPRGLRTLISPFTPSRLVTLKMVAPFENVEYRHAVIQTIDASSHSLRAISFVLLYVDDLASENDDEDAFRRDHRLLAKALSARTSLRFLQPGPFLWSLCVPDFFKLLVPLPIELLVVDYTPED